MTPLLFVSLKKGERKKKKTYWEPLVQSTEGEKEKRDESIQLQIPEDKNK